jgi:negative regulator of sigma E activity
MPDPAAFCLDVDALLASYDVHAEGGGTCLERPVRRLRLEPRSPSSPTLRIAVDAETDLPLEVVTHRPDGELYRVVAFREIEFGPQAVSAQGTDSPAERILRARHEEEVPATEDELEAAADFALLRPDYLPPGFRCIGRRLRLWEATHAVHVYSDGATVFEVHQTRVPTPRRMEENLVRRAGPRRARREAAAILRHRTEALRHLVPDGGEPVARRRVDDAHVRYDVAFGEVEVALIARGDLDPDETLHVLRSLRSVTDPRPDRVD